MGLLDSALSALTNSTASGSSAGQLIGNLLNQQGGLTGLLDKLKQGGLASEVSSWVGTGQNLPVSAGQISAALGNGQLAQITRELGIDPQQASAVLAQVLPHVVDHLTPNGQIPAGAQAHGPNAIADAITAIAGKFLR